MPFTPNDLDDSDLPNELLDKSANDDEHEFERVLVKPVLTGDTDGRVTGVIGRDCVPVRDCERALIGLMNGNGDVDSVATGNNCVPAWE